MPEKFRAFGWNAERVDGNDIDAVRAAFDRARNENGGRPSAIVCDTRMCKGVPFLETRDITHFIRVEPNEWRLALEALDAGRAS